MTGPPRIATTRGQSRDRDARRARFVARLGEHAESPKPMAGAPVTRVRATLSIAEAAWELGVCTETAYWQAKRGELPGAFKFGRRWVVSREAFERWLENR